MIKCWCLPNLLCVDKCHSEDYKNAPMCWRVLINLQAENPGWKLNKKLICMKSTLLSPLKRTPTFTKLELLSSNWSKKTWSWASPARWWRRCRSTPRCPLSTTSDFIFYISILHFTPRCPLSTASATSSRGPSPKLIGSSGPFLQSQGNWWWSIITINSRI